MAATPCRRDASVPPRSDPAIAKQGDDDLERLLEPADPVVEREVVVAEFRLVPPAPRPRTSRPPLTSSSSTAILAVRAGFGMGLWDRRADLDAAGDGGRGQRGQASRIPSVRSPWKMT